MEKLKIRIAGSGAYLPANKVDSRELDVKFALPEGSIAAMTGVRTRYFRDPGSDSVASMAAKAVRAALRDADLHLKDIDALVFASFSYDQPLPCMASRIQRELDADGLFAAFDVKSTCLSFVTALQHVAPSLHLGLYKRVVVVSSESSSAALNWSHAESACLFGDGACAFVFERASDPQDNCGVFLSRMETYSSGYGHCEIPAGGAAIMPREHLPSQDDPRFMFKMDGRKVFKLVLQVVREFVLRAVAPDTLDWNRFDYVIPHQASLTAMQLVRRVLEVPESKWISILPDYGNMISVSIPLALHLLRQEGKLKPGQSVLLIGTSAGLSIGAVGLDL